MSDDKTTDLKRIAIGVGIIFFFMALSDPHVWIWMADLMLMMVNHP